MVGGFNAAHNVGGVIKDMPCFMAYAMTMRLYPPGLNQGELPAVAVPSHTQPCALIGQCQVAKKGNIGFGSGLISFTGAETFKC